MRDGELFDPEERARHAALSPPQAAWLDFVAAHPEALERSAFSDLAVAVDLEPEKVQSWPLFLDPRGTAEIAGAAVETFRLVKTVPERIFGGDPERMAEFYGLGRPLVESAARLLADPACLDHLVARGDFLGGAAGFACCELNVAGNLGGWQVGLWKERFLNLPLVAEFLAAHRLRVLPLNPIDALLEHAVEVGLARGLAAGGELNLTVVTRAAVAPELQALLDQRYRETLERCGAGLSGRFVVCREPELTLDRGRARLGGMPVQLFIDQTVELLDGPIFRAQAAGQGFAFNGVVSPILADKRNLALLSEQADQGDLYGAEERAAIARFIPWTRLLADAFADRAGERVYLPDFARSERERLVIKPPAGFGGQDVLVGAALAQDEWEARLDAALGGGSWILQDFVPPEAYLFQAREGGAALQELVWGAFVFGSRFGSCLMRGAHSGAGVVNVGRGAQRIVLLEVENDLRISSTESTLD